MQLIVLVLIFTGKVNVIIFWQLETAFTKMPITLYKIINTRPIEHKDDNNDDRDQKS